MKHSQVAELDGMVAEFTGQPIPAWKQGISADALMAKTFKPISYVVNGMVAEGLTLFAGAPKIGKSWWALNIAVAIAASDEAFGSIPTEGGDVLYLALEDNQRRLQHRLRMMGLKQAPSRLTLCTQWPTLAGGAVDEISAWAEEVSEPRLVIVDVLARVRDPAGSREAGYDADYRAITGLQELAGRLHLAIVVLHHTRKMDADDPFDSVSGTRGLTGAADSCLVLKRDSGDRRTVLYGRGRDIPEFETAFEFKSDNGTWVVLGEAAEVGRTREREQLLHVLREAREPVNSQYVAEAIGKSEATVRRSLNRMANDGELERPSRGLFTCPKCPKVSNAKEWDNETVVTGLEQGSWLGESPAQTKARLELPQ